MERNSFPQDPIEAACAELTKSVYAAVGEDNLRRAMAWLEENLDADNWLESDEKLAREVILFLRSLPPPSLLNDQTVLGNNLSSPAIVLLINRLLALPEKVREAKSHLPDLTAHSIREKVLIAPWEEGLREV